jgi:hypothetical protein
MNTEQIKDMQLLYSAVYNEELREQFEEYNNTIYDEDIVEVATEYFYSYGLNEDGIGILIEKVGLESFVEYVYELSEDLHILTEERSARRRTGGDSYDEVMAKINAREAKTKAKKEAKQKVTQAASEKKETERKEPESRGVESQAKAEQPKSKKPVRDAIARTVLGAVKSYKAGMERHRAATSIASDTARHVAGETGGLLRTLGNTARIGAGKAIDHLTTHGLKVAKEEFKLGKKKTQKELARYVAALQTLQGNNEEPTTRSQSSGEPTRRRRTNLNDVKIREDIYDTILSHLIDEGYAESVEQAEVIMVNMSEDWRESIVEAKVDAGLTQAQKREVRTARAGRAGVNIPNSSLHTGDVDRRAEHRETDDLNKDAKDIRRGRTNRPQFQGETGKERIAHVKKVKGYS